MKIPKNHNLALLLILIVAGSAATTQASIFLLPRKLAGGESTDQTRAISPAPGPSRAEERRCSSSVKRSCHDHLKDVTACLLYSDKAHRDPILLIQNDGEEVLTVNITISNKFNLKEIELPKNHPKKINISANKEVGTSIIIETGNGNCTILLGLQEQGRIYDQFSAYASQLTYPIHGAYMLFFTVLIVGGVCVCCKLGRSEKQVNRLAYQELQMAQPESHLGTDVETAEGWDQDWGDEWGETKEDKPANGPQSGANAFPSKTSKSVGWENHWDD